MKGLSQTIGTVLLLGAIWGGLGLAAWGLDALPSAVDTSTAVGDEAEGETFEPPREDASADGAGAPDEETGPAEAAAPKPSEVPTETGEATQPGEAPAAGESGEALPPAEPVHRFTLEAPGRDPYIVSLAAGDLTGDGRPELVIGLGERSEVLAVRSPGRLERLLTIRHRPANADETTPSSPPAVVGDATGDGVSDLLVAYWRRAPSIGSRGGGAWILRGKADGTLDRPRRFAGPRMMISSIALADVDGRAGDEVVLGDRGRPYGDIPGRVRVYRAGRRPSLLRDFAAGTNDLRMVLLAHADADALVDLVVFGQEVIRFRNAGRGRFERMEGERKGALFADVYPGLSADLDRDGRLEAYAYPKDFETAVVIVDEGGFRSVPGTADPIHAAVPGEPGQVVVVSGAAQGSWVLATLGADGRLADRRPLRPAGVLLGRPIGEGHAAVVVDLDGDGAPELVTLDTAWLDQVTHWQLAIGPLRGGAGTAMGTIGGEPTVHDLR